MSGLDSVVIIDFGSQFTQLIARRVRESHVYCTIEPPHLSLSQLQASKPKAMILSGGPHSVNEPNAPQLNPELLQLNTPILAICYGMQWLCAHLGGTLHHAKAREFGAATLTTTATSKLTQGIWQQGQSAHVWMSHGDHVTQAPAGFKVLARSADIPIAMLGDDTRKLYGVQFHPEVVHTPEGAKLLARFVHDIAGCRKQWTSTHIIDTTTAAIRAQVQPKGKKAGHVICALSGGVDSAVCAALLQRALGSDSLTCIFIDNGLLRLNEAEAVVNLAKKHIQAPLLHMDEGAMFLQRLDGISDPEDKRRIIGHTFIECFQRAAQQIPAAQYLAQGTVYPDVIESATTSGHATTIKSHHNVGGLPETMPFQLVEPLRALFKDEVRAIGRQLGLPVELIQRHPFPGPGLAIRIPDTITPDKIAILQRADAIYLNALRAAKLYDEIWQAFCVLLPVRSVGVMGDRRSYQYTLALRAVTSTDGMTAQAYPLPHELLQTIAHTIINNVDGINRVLYDVTSKPPATIEWE
ncbi:MAG: glutamine-hydrolyzing GMP synthase [Alphaproteobacteria bacterium GM202ARS2]|nr:glutamine-hydrolyzing GMP synthase [Alphaproteobacteria bacterium GM202ARS2]